MNISNPLGTDVNSYFLLDAVSDPFIIGVENYDVQAEILPSHFSDKSDYDNLIRLLGSNYFWENSRTIKDCELKVDALELKQGARLLDFLRFSPGLINTKFAVSNPVRELISSFQCTHTFFLDSILLANGDKFSYSLLYIESLDRKFLNYSKTVFAIGDRVMGFEVQKLDSEETELECSKQYYDLTVLEVSLDDSFEFKPDIFSLYGKIFISRSLAFSFVEQSFTGMELKK